MLCVSCAASEIEHRVCVALWGGFGASTMRSDCLQVLLHGCYMQCQLHSPTEGGARPQRRGARVGGGCSPLALDASGGVLEHTPHILAGCASASADGNHSS
jgi:hypothetical protein